LIAFKSNIYNDACEQIYDKHLQLFNQNMQRYYGVRQNFVSTKICYICCILYYLTISGYICAIRNSLTEQC